MKRICILTLSVVFCCSINAQSISDFIGSWDFNAPTADYGYEKGIMEIKKESVVTTFTGNSLKYPSDWVKYESDTFKFNMDVDGTYVKCFLKVEDASNLKGYAEWDMGETTLILTRITIKESE